MFKRSSVRYGRTPEPVTPYQKAAQVWDERIGSARVQAKNWRLIAFGNLILAGGLASALVWQSARGSIVPWVVQIDKLGEAQAVAPAIADYQPTDAQIAWHLARFIENVRAIPADPIIVRQNWLKAYDFVTDKGAHALNDYARANDPFAKVGQIQIAVDVASVIRASTNSFRIAWTERRYENASLASTERWTAILDHRRSAAARRRAPAQKSAWSLHPRRQLVEGARTMTPIRSKRFIAALLASTSLSACMSFKPPEIAYDDIPVPAVIESDPEKPVKIVEIPKILPLPGQLKPLSKFKETPEAPDPKVRVAQANAAARVQPRRAGYINAVQIYPFTEGALYQVYASPGEITDIALQEGEQLVGSGPVAAGDTVRWIIGDTESGVGASRKTHIMVKPTRPDLMTNLVINTDRRTYHLELQINREDLYGLRLLAISAGRAHCAAPAQRCRRRSYAGRYRRRSREPQFPLCDRRRRRALAPAARFR